MSTNQNQMTAQSLWPSRGWWIALTVICLLGGALSYTGYNFSLPYIDHPDEPNYSISGRMIIDYGSPKPLGMHGYPPGIIAINYALLRVMHDPGEPPSVVLPVVRLLAITFNLGTIIMIALIGYRVATPLSGLLAAAIWAVTPILVQFSRYGTSDSFVTFFTVLAVFLSLTGTRLDRDRWTTWSMVAVMLAIVFKYQAVVALPVVLIFPLWRIFTVEREGRGRIIKNFVVNLAVLGVFFFWLVVLYPITESNQNPNWSASASFLTFPTPAGLYANLRIMTDELQINHLWLVGLPGLVFMFATAARQKVWLIGLLAILILIGGWHAGLSFYGTQGFRQFLAEMALLLVFLGIGLAGWIHLLAWLLERLNRPSEERARLRISAAVVSAVVALLLIPQLLGAAANAYEHTLPDQRNELARWIDVTLTPAGHIANQANHKTLDGAWGGYAGQNSFPLIEVGHIDDRPLDAWRELGAVYAIEGYGYYENLQATPDGQALLDETLLLKRFHPSQNYRGPGMVALRLSPIQHEADGTLGAIDLIGYDINQTDISSGDTLDFTLYWRANTAPAADYAVFNHLVNESGEVVAQVDADPLPDARRPTSTWTDPEETLISRTFNLAIDTDLEPGAYRLISGFYQRDTGERLLSPDSADSLTITDMTIGE
jgi:hypothetical protein